MAMEQMKEIGVEELQTAQDFVDPDNLVKARAYAPPSPYSTVSLSLLLY